MSTVQNGQFLNCDGGCGARIPVPVGLRTLLGACDMSGPPATAGWLFVSAPHGRRHFCPRCSLHYLMFDSDLDPIGQFDEESVL
ncbi:MAG: hypothetical protein ACLQVD_10245 [Capsulimonadaceae bacterium]